MNSDDYCKCTRPSNCSIGDRKPVCFNCGKYINTNPKVDEVVLTEVNEVPKNQNKKPSVKQKLLKVLRL